ncbi:MAG: mannitol dehydrogenase [Lachnospiraceae bacterium]|jgi:mannitol-1-phosphate 5-dehydrogenase|nr:mannitol dehydrogenase [Lachnospiraceae bacterium]MCI9305639.1 mannitol dehydrogenase [Lachnospiraceae bacterium]MCI9680195.1 mannitol dehydrogenase [Lachnospiraceae bacterium]
MKAVMYGAGNIGRGFIGMLFSASGYEVTFIDVAEKLIDALNREKTYPVRIVSNEGFEDIDVERICAVNGNNTEAAAQAIAEADIMATAVGVNILKYIVPNLAAGIRRRIQAGGSPLNIIICENLIDADKLLAKLIRAELSEPEQDWFDKNIGLVEASIGRMVPVQTEEMKAGNPLRICAEKYDFLPVDKAAFKGEIPDIKNMVPYEPFDFYIKRKLYVHNMGHAICAYLGLYTHKDYIYEAIDDINIQSIVQNAMLESAMALTHKYRMPTEDLVKHFQNLLYRFTNKALKDTCKRVGADPRRKLSPTDRLIGASQLCLEGNISPVFISIGTAAAICEYIRENNLPQSTEQAEKVLESISALKKDHPIYTYVLPVYNRFLSGVSIREIRQFAEGLREKEQKAVI